MLTGEVQNCCTLRGIALRSTGGQRHFGKMNGIIRQVLVLLVAIMYNTQISRIMIILIPTTDAFTSIRYRFPQQQQLKQQQVLSLYPPSTSTTSIISKIPTVVRKVQGRTNYRPHPQQTPSLLQRQRVQPLRVLHEPKAVVVSSSSSSSSQFDNTDDNSNNDIPLPPLRPPPIELFNPNNDSNDNDVKLEGTDTEAVETLKVEIMNSIYNNNIPQKSNGMSNGVTEENNNDGSSATYFFANQENSVLASSLLSSTDPSLSSSSSTTFQGSVRGDASTQQRRRRRRKKQPKRVLMLQRSSSAAAAATTAVTTSNSDNYDDDDEYEYYDDYDDDEDDHDLSSSSASSLSKQPALPDKIAIILEAEKARIARAKLEKQFRTDNPVISEANNGQQIRSKSVVNDVNGLSSSTTFVTPEPVVETNADTTIMITTTEPTVVLNDPTKGQSQLDSTIIASTEVDKDAAIVRAAELESKTTKKDLSFNMFELFNGKEKRETVKSIEVDRTNTKKAPFGWLQPAPKAEEKPVRKVKKKWSPFGFLQPKQENEDSTTTVPLKESWVDRTMSNLKRELELMGTGGYITKTKEPEVNEPEGPLGDLSKNLDTALSTINKGVSNVLEHVADSSFFSLQVKSDVPKTAIQGSALFSIVAAVVAGGIGSGSGIIASVTIVPIFASYLTITRGTVGDTLRYVGTFVWDVASNILHAKPKSTTKLKQTSESQRTNNDIDELRREKARKASWGAVQSIFTTFLDTAAAAQNAGLSSLSKLIQSNDERIYRTVIATRQQEIQQYKEQQKQQQQQQLDIIDVEVEISEPTIIANEESANNDDINGSTLLEKESSDAIVNIDSEGLTELVNGDTTDNAAKDLLDEVTNLTAQPNSSDILVPETSSTMESAENNVPILEDMSPLTNSNQGLEIQENVALDLPANTVSLVNTEATVLPSILTNEEATLSFDTGVTEDTIIKERSNHLDEAFDVNISVLSDLNSIGNATVQEVVVEVDDDTTSTLIIPESTETFDTRKSVQEVDSDELNKPSTNDISTTSSSSLERNVSPTRSGLKKKPTKKQTTGFSIPAFFSKLLQDYDEGIYRNYIQPRQLKTVVDVSETEGGSLPTPKTVSDGTDVIDDSNIIIDIVGDTPSTSFDVLPSNDTTNNLVNGAVDDLVDVVLNNISTIDDVEGVENSVVTTVESTSIVDEVPFQSLEISSSAELTVSTSSTNEAVAISSEENVASSVNILEVNEKEVEPADYSVAINEDQKLEETIMKERSPLEVIDFQNIDSATSFRESEPTDIAAKGVLTQSPSHQEQDVQSPELMTVSDIQTTEASTSEDTEESLGLVSGTLGDVESTETTAENASEETARIDHAVANSDIVTASPALEILSIETMTKVEPVENSVQNEFVVTEADAGDSPDHSTLVSSETATNFNETIDNNIVASDTVSVSSNSKKVETSTSDAVSDQVLLHQNSVVNGDDSSTKNFGRVRNRFLNNHNVRLMLAEYQNAVTSPSIFERDENNVVELKLKRSNRTPVQRLAFCLLSGFTSFLTGSRKERPTKEAAPTV